MPGLCATCLSVDRNVRPFNFTEKSIFVDWFDDLNLEDIQICWECNAMFAKIYKFRTQVFNAQKIRFRVAKKKLRNLFPLSNLSVETKHTYDYTYKEKERKTRERSCKKVDEPMKVKVASDNKGKKHEKDKKEKVRIKKTKKIQKLKKQTQAEVPVVLDTTENSGTSNEKYKIKRKHDNEPTLAQPPKRAKPEEVEIKNTGSNDTTEETKEINRNYEFTSTTGNKFIVHHLSEAGMLKTREIDKTEPVYSRRAFKCEKCIKGYYDKQQFDKHCMEKHTLLGGPHKCPICEVHFIRSDFFKFHYDCHYRSYRCKQCPYEHHKLYYMETHLSKEHEGVIKYDCNVCNKEFGSYASMKYHQQVEHKHTANKCEHCEIIFDSHTSLQDHIAVGCDKSELKTKETENLQSEHDPRSQSVTYICNICKTTFADVYGLRNHLVGGHPALTDPEANIRCPCCSKRFFARSALLAHIRTHTGDKPFECKACHKRFAVEYVLKKHFHRMHRNDDNN